MDIPRSRFSVNAVWGAAARLDDVLGDELEWREGAPQRDQHPQPPDGMQPDAHHHRSKRPTIQRIPVLTTLVKSCHSSPVLARAGHCVLHLEGELVMAERSRAVALIVEHPAPLI